ncbi:tetraacyldisaccharide 4'-kinase [Thalassotalea sp. LPB0316]|uniref:tetraacyldisaccharide 4'-kinase n=1 Tax=Thalassotalea sp. LPB0316 TaxID=2769490 RepID=UPI00186652AC|nr:tetraacyldisaccharide 4'-kinase [Thalassotalea sp. LPB0316]QOL24482.1 tetraacyldisaccharide 4'-kinase [Thalassotalea sp. LPB0316]
MRLIERVWFDKHPARFVLVPLLLPFSALFYVISRLRKFAFDCGLKDSFKAKVPIVVVGNIGVGGNGKTPIVLWLVELLRAQGYQPGVISRGYGGKAPQYPYLLDENSQVQFSGDEPFLIYQRTKVPVCVGANRRASVEKLQQLGCDIIVADDGMQHYKLGRDIEVAVVDGKRRFGNGLLLPAGPLRELPARLTSVDMVICNSGQPQAGEIAMDLLPSQFVNLVTGEKCSVAEFLAKHKAVNAIAGIGSPARFFNTLTALGLTLNHSQGFVDHHHYQMADFDQLPEPQLPLLMTEKDAVKCQDFNLAHAWYLTVEAKLDEQCEQLLLSKISDIMAKKA